MLAVSTTNFDINGSFVLSSKEATILLGSMGRRNSKTATLDGGVSVYDTGLSQGDREFNVVLTNPTRKLVDKIKTLMINHTSFNIILEEGVFNGSLVSLNETLKRTSFKISILSKVL